MKKLLLAAIVLGSAMCASAQEDYATKAGSFSTEIQFNPFSGSDVFSNGGVFSGAYFMTDKCALIFDLGLNGTNDKTTSYIDDPNDSSNNYETYSTEYEGEFQLGIGFKYFFYNYKRVNLYAGAKVSYVHQFAGTKNSNSKNDDYDWSNEGTGNGFGVHALTGINFNLYKGLYVGAEIQLGFKDVLKGGYTEKSQYGNQLDETKYKAGGHTFDGGFNVTPMFVLGWAF